MIDDIVPCPHGQETLQWLGRDQAFKRHRTIGRLGGRPEIWNGCDRLRRRRHDIDGPFRRVHCRRQGRLQRITLRFRVGSAAQSPLESIETDLALFQRQNGVEARGSGSNEVLGRAKPDLRDVLFVGVSQSGGSPDLVGSLRTARECGALTLAVTNAPGSPLAEQAQLHIDVRAGSEKAVAATKSYTAELLALYLLVDALRDGDGSAARGLVDATSGVVSGAEQVRSVAARFAGVERLVVTGRGYSYPTAREAALKLMETSYVAAQAFSGADLLHGPMAMLQDGSAVIAIAAGGVSGQAIAPVLDRLVELGTNLVVVGNALDTDTAVGRLALPAGLPEELSPIVEIVPLQMLARELAVIGGHDPDAPRGLRKVTETW